MAAKTQQRMAPMLQKTKTLKYIKSIAVKSWCLQYLSSKIWNWSPKRRNSESEINKQGPGNNPEQKIEFKASVPKSFRNRVPKSQPNRWKSCSRPPWVHPAAPTVMFVQRPKHCKKWEFSKNTKNIVFGVQKQVLEKYCAFSPKKI